MSLWLVENLGSLRCLPMILEILQLVGESSVAIENVVLDAAQLHVLQSKCISITLQYRCVSCGIAHVPTPRSISSGQLHFQFPFTRLTGSS